MEAQFNAKLAEEGFKLPNKALTFDTLARDWLATYPAKKSVAAKTVANYRWLLDRHLIPYFRSTPVVSITPDAVETFIVAKKDGTHVEPLGSGSLRIAVLLLTLLLDRAVRDDVITKNPARTGPGGRRFLSARAIQATQRNLWSQHTIEFRVTEPTCRNLSAT